MTKSEVKHEKFLKYNGGMKYVYVWNARCGVCFAHAAQFWKWDMAVTWLKVHWREKHGSAD